jgi:taurine transport system permease protein
MTATLESPSLTAGDRSPAKAKRPFLYRPTGIWLVRIVTFAVLMVAWQIYASGVSKALLATPTEIASALVDMAQGSDLWQRLYDSMFVLVIGLLLSLLVGIPIGLAMGRFKPIGYLLDPYVSFLYALPHVSMVPLMIILLGYETKFRLAYVIFSAIWPVIINAYAGVRAIDPAYLDAAKAYCANEAQIARRIVLPATAPFLVAGGRQALSAAWVAVVVSEMLSTLVGMGGLIKLASTEFQTAEMFVAIFLIMVIATVLQAFASWVQDRATPWANRGR